MGLAFGSINTGLPKDIVKQIIAAERIPITQMEARKANLTEKKGLVDQFSKLFQELNEELVKTNTSKSLRVLKVTANDELVDVQVDENLAEAGEYRFSVEQLAQKSSALTTGFADPDDSYVGVGYIRYNLPEGGSNSIYIDSDHASLRGVAELINAEKESGLKAKVVNDGSRSDAPWRLVISLAKTGDEFAAEFPYLYFVDGDNDFSFEEQRTAHNAVVTLDGFELELPDNKTSDLIEGLTIDLKKASPGEEFTIKIEEDREAIASRFKNLVDKLNAILRFVRDQNTMDARTNTQKTLGGDVTVQMLEGKLRTLIFQTFETRTGNIARFGDLGITFQKDGLLRIQEDKLKAKMARNFNDFSDLMVGYINEDGEKKEGFLNTLSEFTRGVLAFPNGVLPLKKSGLQSQSNQIDRQIENRERMIDQKEKALRDKFARLEETMNKLRSQGASLSAMAGANAGAETVQDLGSGMAT